MSAHATDAFTGPAHARSVAELPPLKLPDLIEALQKHRPCGEPEDGDGILYLNARCHPDAGTVTAFCQTHKVLHIACKKCNRLIANIAVAKEYPQ